MKAGNPAIIPEYGRAAAEAVAKGECDFGIVICTTGIGISIVANKVKGNPVRALFGYGFRKADQGT